MPSRKTKFKCARGILTVHRVHLRSLGSPVHRQDLDCAFAVLVPVWLALSPDSPTLAGSRCRPRTPFSRVPPARLTLTDLFSTPVVRPLTKAWECFQVADHVNSPSTSMTFQFSDHFSVGLAVSCIKASKCCPYSSAHVWTYDCIDRIIFLNQNTTFSAAVAKKRIRTI